MNILQIALAIICFLAWTFVIFLLGYFIGWVAQQNRKGACPFANLPPAKEKEPRGIQITPFAGKEKMIIALLILTSTFTACLPKATDPLIVEKPIPCSIPALQEREPLPTIEWYPYDPNSAERCLSEAEYQELKEMVAMLRAYEKYLSESYRQTRIKCGQNNE